MTDPKYLTKVYLKQGGDELVGADGGKFNMEDGFSFFFDGDVEVEQENLKAFLQGAVTTQTIGQGAASTVFSVLNLPSRVKYFFLSMTSTCINASVYLCSGVIAGDWMYIIVRSGSCASGVATVLLSGVSLVTFAGADNSKIVLNNSTNSFGAVKLVCLADGVWSVVDPIAYPSSTLFT